MKDHISILVDPYAMRINKEEEEDNKEEEAPEPEMELPLTKALAIYDAEINDTPLELIINTGAIKYYLAEDFARK
jgi:hypothetical protein